MQPSSFSNSSSASWMSQNNSKYENNFIFMLKFCFVEYCSSTTTNSNFWPNGGFRKRKAAASDLDDK